MVNEELRKTPMRSKANPLPVFETQQRNINETSAMSNVIKRPDTKEAPWYLQRISMYPRILRVIAWTLRFIDRCKKIHPLRKGEISAKEITTAEALLCKLAQEDAFKGESDPRLKGLKVFKENGLLRTRTLIANRLDTFCFRYPIILDSKHPLTLKIIHYTHAKLCHAGIGIVMSNLREKFWILRSRKTVRSVINSCVVCRRQDAKRLETSPAILPESRVRDAVPFEVTGIDFAGPLFLIEGYKAYVCLFTCAVHLELTTS